MRKLARSFGQIAAEYDAVRPDYPPEAVERAVEALELHRDARVVDLAAGSGTLTRALADRFPRLVAIEPDDEMRAVFARRSPGVEVRAGTAERIPLQDRSADAVFVADAFHWFDGPAAVVEIARVLRPTGGVALVWNRWWEDGDDGTTDFLEPRLPSDARALFDEVYVRSGRRAARDKKADPVDCFTDSPFGPLRVETFEQRRRLTGPEVVDLYSTVSAVAALPALDRDQLKRKMLPMLDAEYRLTITTVLHWGRRA